MLARFIVNVLLLIVQLMLLFHGLWILVIEQINKLQISKFMYCLTQDLLPSASLGCVSSMSNVHAYHTGALKNVCGIAARTNTDCLQLNVPAYLFWNNLSTDIHNYYI